MCHPRLFIIRCSITQARGQLLPCSRPASSSPLRAYIHSQHLLFFAFLHSLTDMRSPPVHRLFVFLPLSCFPSPYSYPPRPLHLSLLDSISLDNEGMIQLSLARCSDQSASVFPSDCACVLRLDPAASNATEAGMSVRIALCSL